MQLYQDLKPGLEFKITSSNVEADIKTILQKEQILVVDDTPANLKVVSDFLNESGFDVRIAKSGSQALKILEKVSPDLILLDVMMPDMDGFETCCKLKAWEKTKDIPVIFMTAVTDSSNPTYKIKGLTLGAVDYISKPIQLEEVLARVKIHLHLRSLTQQLQTHNTLLQTQVSALQNIQDELVKNARRSALRSDIGFALSQQGTLFTILSQCAAAFVEHLEVAFARIWTLNSEEMILELQASAGMYTHINGAHARVPVGSLKIGRIASERQPHLTNDVLNDPRISNPEWARREGMVAFAGYPLIVEDRLVGVMAMFARHPLDETTLDTLASVANEIAVGIERKRTEIALKTSEANLAAAQRVARVGNWKFDIFTQTITWSEELFHIFGLDPKPGEPTYAQLVEMIHPEARSVFERKVNRAIAKGIPYKIDLRIMRPDGQMRQIETRGKPVFNEQRQIVQLFGTVLDITQRKEAETLLTGQNHILELIAADAPLPKILEALARLVEERSGQMRCSFLLLDKEGRLRFGSAPSLPDSYNQRVDGITIGPNVGSCGTAAYHKTTVIVGDIATDPLWENFKDIALSYGLRACWSTPILTNDQTVLGTFAGYYDKPQTPTPRDRSLIAQTLYLAKIAIERQRSQQALCQSEERLQLALEGSGDGLWDWNIQTGEFYVSPRWTEMLGYDFGELPRDISTWEKLIHPEDKLWVRELLKAHFNDSSIPYKFDYRMLTKCGEWKWIANYGKVVVRDENGLPMRITGTHRDISERKQIEVALRQSETREREKAQALEQALEELKHTQTQLIQTEKMSSLGRMVGGIAHEINNPVSFIAGNLNYTRQYFQDLVKLIELYQRFSPNPQPEIQQFMAEIEFEFLLKDLPNLMQSMQVGTERICQMVRSLKSFSRLNEAELKSVDIHEAINNVLLLLQNRLRAEGTRPEIKVIKNYTYLPPITCYASQLNQVFMNLLDNAIEALESQPEPRIISITTEFSSDLSAFDSPLKPSIKTQISTLKNDKKLPSIIIRIADNGIGMNQEVYDHIFDPFFTTKPIGSGVGLGLAISHQIVVEKHKGKLSCISVPSQGTELIVEIPINCETQKNSLSCNN